MADTKEQLQQAFALMKRGNRQEAIAIVQSVLKQDRANANAWWLLANLLDDEERKVKALERVLAIEPKHKGANAMMAKIGHGVDLGTPEGGVTQEKMTKTKFKEKEDDPDMALPLSIRIAFGVLILFVLGLVAIFGIMPILQGAGPDRVANNYLQAFGDQDYDRMRELTCEKDLPLVDLLEQRFTSMTQQVPESEAISFGVSELTTELIGEEDGIAYVKVGGVLNISAGEAMEISLDFDQLFATTGLPEAEANMRLIQESGWKVCDP